MGLARTLAVTLTGLAGHIVEVEAHAAQGLPGFTLVGLPDAAVRESRERVRAALSTRGGTRGEPCLNNGLQSACIRFQALGCNQGFLLSKHRISSRLCGNPFAARARAKQAPAGVGGAESTVPI